MKSRTRSVTALVAGTAAVVLVPALMFAGGVDTTVIPGLPDAGPVTPWALPVVTTLSDLLAVLLAGVLVTAAFLLPGDGPSVSAHGWQLLRRATWLAAAWLLVVVARILFSVSDVLGVPVPELGVQPVAGFALSISQGQALMWQAGLILLVVVLSRAGLSRGLAAVTTILALVAIVPPVFTGHAAGAGDHQLAVSSLVLHVLAATLWIGGLGGLLLVRRARAFPEAVARYSRLALACLIVTAVSGAANAAVRLGAWSELFGSRYGLLVLAKVLALGLVGLIGALHRARTLPALRTGRPRAFLRLAVGELVVLGAAIGLAVALSRSPAPQSEVADLDPLTELLGFPAPLPPTGLRMLGDPLPDMFILSLTVAGIAAYLIGVVRLRKAGHHWPLARTASWTGGLLLLAAITCLGVARYAYVLFSVHMIQHMVLSMVVPILLVGGAPVTLALRALRRPADPRVRGPREWLLIVLHSRAARLFTHPLVALGIYVASLYGLYFSDLLGILMRYHLGHLAMIAHFVIAGYLLFWVLIGTDPGRRRIHPALLVMVHFLAMVAHAFFGFVLLQSATIIGLDWYAAVHPAWAQPLLDDQRLGAGLAWAFGELPAAAILLVLVRQWIRSDEREQARTDRASDRAVAAGEDDELARYNAYLGSLPE